MNTKSIVSDLSLVEEIEQVPVLDIAKIVDAIADMMFEEGKIADVLIAHGAKRAKRFKCRKNSSAKQQK